MKFDLDFPRAYPDARASGTIKSATDDFYVEEQADWQLDGDGEHDWLWVEKRGQNTDFVARAIARHASVRDMDVGFSGLKDRHAVTRQWFSVYRRGGTRIDWGAFVMEGVQILEWTSHRCKLRRGDHHGNRFCIRVTELCGEQHIEPCMQKIAAQGFPNYYGEQRFGRDAENLERGARFFRGELKASRRQRGYYLSAARSYLFNLNLAQAVRDGSWRAPDASGPLYGDPSSEDMLNASEQAILAAHPAFAEGIHRNRLKLERRPYRIMPEALSWEVQGGMLTLKFDLPKGVFATSLLKELLDYRTGNANSSAAQGA